MSRRLVWPLMLLWPKAPSCDCQHGKPYSKQSLSPNTGQYSLLYPNSYSTLLVYKPREMAGEQTRFPGVHNFASSLLDEERNGAMEGNGGETAEENAQLKPNLLLVQHHPQKGFVCGSLDFRKSGSIKALNLSLSRVPESMTYAATEENPHTLLLLSRL